MRLRKVGIQNFKLLKDVELQFSTDTTHPLTVVRAENGSGKTSLLYAMLWAFYGVKGIEEARSETRLSPTHWPPGEPCDISVRVEFDVREMETYAGEEEERTTSYVLTRQVTETPEEGNDFRRQADTLVIYVETDEGHDQLDDAAARALIRRLVPPEMKGIFFTDGDKVQRFITGDLGTKARQAAVHDAIRALLGLDSLRLAERDLEKARTIYRKRLAAAPGAKGLEAIQTKIEEKTAERDRLRDVAESLNERLANISDVIDKRETRLYELKDLGDIDKIRSQRDKAKEALDGARAQLEVQKRAQRELMRSEYLTWAAVSEPLEKGVLVLQELADRNVIPGTSVEVLRDRLSLGVCICGEPLHEGSEHYKTVEVLIEEQMRVDPNRQRLTALLHGARLLHEENVQRQAEDAGWLKELAGIEKTRAVAEKQVREQLDTLKECEEGLRRLEDVDIDRQLDLQKRDRAKRDEFIEQRRENELRLTECEKDLADLETRYQEVKSQLDVSSDLEDRVTVTEDLLRLVQRTLETLEGDYLRRASDRMNDLFMKIAGSVPEVSRSVFNEVRIAPNYDIEVLSGGHGRTLDPDFEINGASKRALTLSFIWGLMEVAEVSAPRIIDTPLGMTSGGVKKRFVDLLTQPTDSEFQVVLLMTRSEISGIEELVDERAGLIRTLSCSKDYPVDLVNDWDADAPTVCACVCTHRESCKVCARRDDRAYSLSYRET